MVPTYFPIFPHPQLTKEPHSPSAIYSGLDPGTCLFTTKFIQMLLTCHKYHHIAFPLVVWSIPRSPLRRMAHVSMQQIGTCINTRDQWTIVYNWKHWLLNSPLCTKWLSFELGTFTFSTRTYFGLYLHDNNRFTVTCSHFITLFLILHCMGLFSSFHLWTNRNGCSSFIYIYF